MQMIGEEKNINNMQMQQINDWQKDNRNELRKPAYKPLATAHTHTIRSRSESHNFCRCGPSRDNDYPTSVEGAPRRRWLIRKIEIITMLTTGATSTATQMIESNWCPEPSHWNDRHGITCVQPHYYIDGDLVL